MIKKLMIVGLLFMFLSATSFAFAENVYITARGSKYHKQECRLIKNKESLTEIDKTEAVDQGYGPCKRCYKEDAVTKESEDKEKKSK